MLTDMEIPEDLKRDLEHKGGFKGLIDRVEDEYILEQSRIHKALSNPIRLKILALLDEQDLCVCLLKKILDIKDSKLSYHLSVLKKEDLIEGERDANFVIYRIKEKGKTCAP